MRGEPLPPNILPDEDQVLEHARLNLEPVPRAARAARRFVREHAPELPAETEESLLLLTSELVSNAVLHARTAIELVIVVADLSVVVTVHDLDLAAPLQDPYAAAREGGWGLELVSVLAQSYGTLAHPGDGKTAWFRLLRDDAHPVRDGAAARTDSARRD